MITGNGHKLAVSHNCVLSNFVFWSVHCNIFPVWSNLYFIVRNNRKIWYRRGNLQVIKPVHRIKAWIMGFNNFMKIFHFTKSEPSIINDCAEFEENHYFSKICLISRKIKIQIFNGFIEVFREIFIECQSPAQRFQYLWF